jgi:UDP-N-acetylmuramoyl-L-alanyl-D-glutamate--2,6-diaminopimelate ligase
MSCTFDELVSALPGAQVLDPGRASAWPPPPSQTGLVIESIVSDSRQASPGSLFVAYRGVAVDGHDFALQAIKQGAVAIVAERELGDVPVPVVVVPNGREALAYLSAAWHGHPARQMVVVGITGTDGKTTTCNLLHSILVAAGRRAGLITTVNAVIGERVMDTGLHTTTPDAPDVQRYLAQMAAASMEIAILETTSHGLEQHRVSACDFDLAVVTNVTHEHLDLHGSLAGYQQAKAMLFHHLTAGHRKPGRSKVAVLNADDESYAYLRPIPADEHLAYGLEGAHRDGAHRDGVQIVAVGIRRSAADTRFTILSPERDFAVRTRLVGDYNVSNILAATSAALSLEVPVEAIQQGVWQVQGIVGRMERVDEGQSFLALIDFAHTPNALQRALEAVRTMTEGRVIAVYGSAGERDVAKRAWMGQIGARLADLVVLTAEDPRTEPVDAILDEMARGAEKAGAVEGQSYFRVSDRAEAIQFAVDLAQSGDLVIACGKGHEQSMCYGTEETPWSEHEALRAALRRRQEREGGD